MAKVTVKKLSICYGRTPIVHDVSFSVDQGQIAAIVGPNGAGKTTILKAIAGLIRPIKGEIFVNNIPTSGLTVEELVKLGVVYIPEGMSVFEEMSVEENLEVGAYLQREHIKEKLKAVFQIFPELEKKRKTLAGMLSGGEQRMVTIGRGLVTEADVFLLDDPFLGLSPAVTSRFCEVFRTLRENGKTLIIAGQHVRRLLRVADRGFLVEDGHLSLEGSGSELLNNVHLMQVLFGHLVPVDTQAK
ncbi:MAG: ABC transporter ATP-binding protein [Thermodesulforhabdaceae bacterium]|jgi:branched-chain amino acid transport system ATP-binding protein